MKKIGDILKELRKSKGKTQEEIANEMNSLFDIKINKGMISKWESNKSEPIFKYVKLFSSYYNVSVDFLLGLNDDESYQIKESLSNILQLMIKDYKENPEFYENFSQCNEESLKNFTDYLDSTFDEEIKALGENFTSRVMLELYVYVNKIVSFELNKIISKVNKTTDEITATIDNVINITNENTEEYTLAAHDDGLDEETKKRNLEKAKAMFKQMDEE